MAFYIPDHVRIYGSTINKETFHQLISMKLMEEGDDWMSATPYDMVSDEEKLAHFNSCVGLGHYELYQYKCRELVPGLPSDMKFFYDAQTDSYLIGFIIPQMPLPALFNYIHQMNILMNEVYDMYDSLIDTTATIHICSC